MDYTGPDRADFANVHSLNRAYLDCLRRARPGAPMRQRLAPEFRPLLERLTDPQMRRLAAAPFLLFSLREGDDAFWMRLFGEQPNRDLFTASDQPDDDAGKIVAAALGFLWQLARQNPYAARIVCGATLNWCEQLAQCTLYRLLERASMEQELLQPRLCDNTEFWARLLSAGLSSEHAVRSAAHLAALQTTLTDRDPAGYRRLPAAACRIPVETLEVAENSGDRKQPKKL